jgi:hypothetical protein
MHFAGLEYLGFYTEDGFDDDILYLLHEEERVHSMEFEVLQQ